MAIFHQIWTSEGPNVVKIPNTRVSDLFPVTFPGGKFWYNDKKKLAHFWARREARFAICPFFFTKKYFFDPACFSAVQNSQKGRQTHPGWLSSMSPPVHRGAQGKCSTGHRGIFFSAQGKYRRVCITTKNLVCRHQLAG